MTELRVLSDDSLLIDAFGDAMSKYKRMHKNKDTESSEGAGNDSVGSTKDNAATGADESNKFVRELGGNHSKTGTAEIEKQTVQDNQDALSGSTGENHCKTETAEIEKHTLQDNQGAMSSSMNLQGTEEHNRLLGQYYELDEKGLKIWEQLQRCVNWSYQYSGETTSSVTQGEVSSAPQEYPTAASPTERSMTIDSSTNLNEGENVKANEIIQETTTTRAWETDLPIVLRAWYAAGFYTGKYITEQSLLEESKGSSSAVYDSCDTI